MDANESIELEQYKKHMIENLNELMNNTDEINKDLEELKEAGVDLTKEEYFKIRMDDISRITYKDMIRLERGHFDYKDDVPSGSFEEKLKRAIDIAKELEKTMK